VKTTEHGIEESRDVENVYHLRLMALLQELVRREGHAASYSLCSVWEPRDERNTACGDSSAIRGGERPVL